MKTLIAAVALAIGLITVPAYLQAAGAESSVGTIDAGKSIGAVQIAQYCVPEEDEGVVARKIYCRSPG
jgi:hypothetical protein